MDSINKVKASEVKSRQIVKVKRKDGSIMIGTINDQPTKCQQNQAEQADINKIVKKYLKTGELPNQRAAVYADVSQLPDYHQAMNTVARAKDAFNSLPSEIRSKFYNDPKIYLDWMNDKKNLEESYNLKLRVKPSLSTGEQILQTMKEVVTNTKKDTEKK